ncbi:MAG: T9SS type A sorting domain-containing protein, partial [Lewinella sp.]|nr:T9SS type A sorting domain-containing protein [Lewinella sp.]
APNLGNTGVSVEAIAPDERIVWVLTAKPDNSDYTLGMEFQTPDCRDPFENYGELAVANTSRVIRVNSNAPTNGGGDPIVGSYVLEAYILNCETGCASDPIGTFTITVEGEEAPVLDCSNLNMTFPNTEGLCEGDVTLPVPGATDDCEVVTLEYRYREVDENNDPIGLWSDWANSEDNDLTLPVGIYRVRWRAIDALGQQDACTRFVTVEDVEAPEAICNGFTVVFNGEDDISLDPADLAVVSDNCDVATHTIAPTEVSCADLGEEIAVVSTVTDIHGLSSTCTSLVTVDGLPCGWMTWDDHVDCPGSSADYDVFSETFYLTSAACSHTPYSPLDEAYANVKTVLCGDGEIIARVSSLDGLGKAWAGITMRENNDPGSKKFQVMTGLDHLQHRVDWRTSTDGFNQTQNFSRFGHQWLRIVRTGPIFQAFTSLDGVIWSQPVNTQVIAMEECLEVGLIVTNVPYASNVTAGFDHVQVTPPYAPNPNRPDVANGQPTDAVYLETFPNPTSGQLTLNLSAFLDQEATLEVLDLNGQLLFQRQLGLVEQSTEQLDLSSYAAGMYFVRVLTNDGTAAVQRVILQPRP